MGVHGLWQLLSSTGKPVPLESLEGKVLAVDVSVWLHQLSKGMRDSSGNPVPNAHLHGLFTRICKLLYYRIKPVFVFDGGVPLLKKQTLASRRNKREEAERTSSLMQQKILTNLIRSQALKEACGLDTLPNLPPVKSSAKGGKDMLFELPPLPESSKSYLADTGAEDETYMERRELQQMVEDQYEDLDKIDVESEDFQALPPEIQHEIITDMRLRRKNYNLNKIVELPDDSKDFSNFQLARLIKHNKLNTRLDQVRKDLNDRQTQALTKNYRHRFQDTDDIYSQRVVSDDSSHYILAKRNLQKRKEIEEKSLQESGLETAGPQNHEGNEIDELLKESDEEDYAKVDILEESRLIVEEISEKLNCDTVEQNKNFKQHRDIDEENSRNYNEVKGELKDKIEVIDVTKRNNENIDIARSFVEHYGIKGSSEKPQRTRNSYKDSKTNSIPERKTEAARNEKPRFKAVIEVESGSDSESSSDLSEIFCRRTGNPLARLIPVNIHDEPVIIGDDQDDPELQIAIEQSLQQRKSEHISYIKDIDQYNVEQNKIAEKSSRQYENTTIKHEVTTANNNTSCETDRKTGSEKRQYLKEEKAASKKDKHTKNRSVLNVIKSQTEAMNSEMQRKDSLISGTVVETKCSFDSDSDRSEGRRGQRRVLKRKISTLSENSSDSGKVDRKVIKIASSDSEASDGNESNSDSEDDFIEVKIDLTEVKEDELFPASIFDMTSDDAVITSGQQSNQSKTLYEQSRGNESPTETRTVTAKHQKENEDTFLTPDHHTDTEPSSPESQNTEVDVTMVTDTGMETKDAQKNTQNVDTNVTMETADHDEAVSIATPEEDFVAMETGSILALSKESDDAEAVRPSITSPVTTSLVKQFESINEQRVKALSDNLAFENKELRLEQGRQERLAVSITDQMHAEAQELLQLFGIPFIVSPTEAEAQCAQLELIKLTHGTITDDSDIWLFGGKCVFKNFFNQQKHVECFKDINITSQLGLTREGLINIAMLCGSDYTDGIRGVGPVTAMEILAKFPGQGVEGLIKFKSWWEQSQKQIQKPIKESKFLAKLRDLDIHPGFPNTQVVEAYLSPAVDDSAEKFTWSMPNENLLREFAGSKLKWNREKTDEVLLPVIRRLGEKQHQRSISAFFQPEIYMKPAPMKSKRLQKVVEKFIYPTDEASDSDSESKKTSTGKPRKGKKGEGQSEGHHQGEGQQETECQEQSKDINSRSEDQTDKEKNESNKAENQKGTRKTVRKCPDKGTGSKQVHAVSEGKSKGQRKGKVSSKINNSDKLEGFSSEINEKQTVKPSAGRGRGRGRSLPLKLKDKRSRLIESEDDSVSVSSSANSESDSTSPETDSDAEGNEVTVVESGLNIEEILNLKMGCKLNELKTNKSTARQQDKVFENVVNVNEILHLDSGADELIIGQTEVGFENSSDKPKPGIAYDESQDVEYESDIENDNNTMQNLNEDTALEKDLDDEIDDKFANEGGFIKEDSAESNDTLRHQDTKSVVQSNSMESVKSLHDNISGKHNLETEINNLHACTEPEDISDHSEQKLVQTRELCKQETKQTRSSATNKRRNKTDQVEIAESESEVPKITVKVEPFDEFSHKFKSAGTDSNKSVKSDETDKKLIAYVGNKAETSEKAKSSSKKQSKQVKSIYESDPIKPVVSGLPWADKGKGRRKGLGGRGQGSIKIQKVVPLEKVVKREKGKSSRDGFGNLNLSESDSDD